MKKTISSIVLIAAFFIGAQSTFAAITATLDVGSSGSNVTELQTYLAQNASIYPSGMITGYFGPLTQAAVQRFQIAQGIVSAGTPATTGFGRVGPTTMARINSLMGSGAQVSWDAAPIMGPASIQYGSTNVTISWSNNELSQGQVYYSTVPLALNEASGPRQQPYVSGTAVVDNGNTMSHSITLQNLQPRTTYYFLTRAVDATGNMSMTWPSSFQTNQ